MSVTAKKNFALLDNYNSIVKIDISLRLKDIDPQHQKIFILIDNVKNSLISDNKIARNLETIRELKYYTKSHFKYEETMLEFYNYSNLKQHINLHEEFIDEIEHIEDEIKKGSNAISTKLLGLLYNWLMEHILCEDRKYADELRGQI